MYVCHVITFESLDVVSSYLHIRCISREYRSSLCMKVIGSRSRLHSKKGHKCLSVGNFCRYSPDGATDHALQVVTL